MAPALVAVLCWTLLLLTPGCWWAVGVVIEALWRHPDISALRAQLVYFSMSALAATGGAVIGGNYLLGSPLPRGAGLLILIGILIVPAAVLHLFLIGHYRRR